MSGSKNLTIIVCALLVVITGTLYWPVRNHDFILFDDPAYATDNVHILEGLSKESVVWALTTTVAANWHPLTWLSHMLDREFFGADAGMHHVVNVIFHLVNTVLVFLVFRRPTGSLWCSAFVAAAFGVHPLHVESVAWISERKDVLSTLFWLLVMLVYSMYVERPSPARYLIMVLLYLLGLTAKPMLVSLPFVLLLMDVWPLGRLHIAENSLPHFRANSWKLLLALAWEKTPLFVLSAASCIMTYLAQAGAGAVSPLEKFPLSLRAATACISYVNYLLKTFLPYDLGVFYPFDRDINSWEVSGAVVLLLLVTTLCVITFRRAPWLLVGWLWYVGTLVPVIGIVKIGSQAMADRYTYIPLFGIFIMIAWSVAHGVRTFRYRDGLVAVSFIGCVFVLSGFTFSQVQYWANGYSLFSHTLRASGESDLAHRMVGIHLRRLGKFHEALFHYRAALRIHPDDPKCLQDSAFVLFMLGKVDEAIDVAKRVGDRSPELYFTYNLLGLAYSVKGNLKEAVAWFNKAVEAKTDSAEAYLNLGKVLFRLGKMQDALETLSRAVELDPDSVEGHNNLARVLRAAGRSNEGLKHFQRALELDPQNTFALENMSFHGKKGGGRVVTGRQEKN